MAQYTVVSGTESQTRKKDWEFKFGQMVLSMKDCGNKGKLMAKVGLF